MGGSAHARGMAQEDDDALLAAWLEQVARIPERGDGPDARGYADIALELGLTEADLARVEATVDDHVARGRNFLAHTCFDDAVREWRAARALAPWRPDVAHGLAEAHAARFHEAGDTRDRAEAEALARARLAKEPDHQPSYVLLRALSEPRPSRWRAWWPFGARQKRAPPPGGSAAPKGRGAARKRPSSGTPPSRWRAWWPFGARSKRARPRGSVPPPGMGSERAEIAKALGLFVLAFVAIAAATLGLGALLNGSFEMTEEEWRLEGGRMSDSED